MGIFKAIFAATESMAQDQWKEFFYCNGIPNDILMVRGYKQGNANANNGNPDVITEGSTIAVNEGQCAIVVSNGKVISTFTEPGEHEFKSGESAGVFSGSSLKSFGKELGRRISYGGDAPPIVQRVYYLNTKEILGIKFGDSVGIPFRIFDEARNLDIDCTLVTNGLFSFRIYDPAKIYKQLMGNVTKVYDITYLVNHMKTEVNSIIRDAVSKVMTGSYRPNALSGQLPEIEKRVVETANEKLREVRGIELVSLAFDTFRITERDSGLVRDVQRAAINKDTNMAAATLVGATADAMINASNN